MKQPSLSNITLKLLSYRNKLGCLSLPRKSDICGQGLDPTIRVDPHKQLHSGRLYHHLQILDCCGS